MKKVIAIFIGSILSLSVYAQYTGFQRSLNDKPWGILQTDKNQGPVFAGSKAERFEVRQGDCGFQPNWNDCTSDRERAEMSELKPYTQLAQPTWYSWSFYLDPNWPDLTPVTTTIGQFHQRDVETPALLFIQRDNAYKVRIESAKEFYAGKETYTLVQPADLRNRWHTVIVYAKWSTGPDGELKVWINGKQRVDLKGPNTKFTTPVYFKYGIYRSFVSRTPNRPAHIVFIDEVRKGPTRESVDLAMGKIKPLN
jgi:hypothetical protein